MRIILIMMTLVVCSCMSGPQVPESVLEVPDPGSKNNETLAGIDSDNDGVRDDVQRWINRNYYKEPNKQMALKQYAKYQQQVLINSDDKKASVQYTHKLLNSQQCYKYVFGIKRMNRGALRSLRPMILNTKERIQADIRSDKNFHGQIIRGTGPSKWKKLCEFVWVDSGRQE